MQLSRRDFSAALVAPLAGALMPAFAQNGYPGRTVRIIVPYPAGGFNDTLARVVGKKLQDSLGQPFIADNKPGGGTIIGTEAGVKSPPDGYTLFIASFPTVVNQFLYKNLPYSVQRDVAPIILAGYAPNLLVVRSDSPYRTVKDLVAAAKAAPDRLNYASAGSGTSLHLAMEYFKSVTGTRIAHIPYKGSAPMITDLLGGQVDVMFDNLPNAMPHVQSGRMRALGVTSLKRLAAQPDIPTIAEQGYPGFEISPWYGIAAPAGTPRAILVKLNAEVARILTQPDVKAIFAAQGVEIAGGSVEDFDRYIKAQSARWEPIVRNANIALD
ncbi:Bug family tripartite tricarboxylate transporter substrate binding protein [Paracidovorax anthurii]|uniref:Tripartite-type tricarboxylate transporter receptor subunit TctC n=1 Tax=Paracidovorax anthurii TaxID=78229 RepID=A0A328ZGU1_9BURK|nr:tripartite tricarboxylate transporter substrate binding protein [Paracidovorax anthurii]RAR85141.1 tripartite-type tricarboxylate transporter receptor subunit TctC [Paracidovorax anthurii]